MTGSDPGGTSSFNSAGKWSNGLPPAPGNSYLTTYTMRTPESGSSFTFAGDSLKIAGNGVFGIKSWGALTIDDFILDGGAITLGLITTLVSIHGNITVQSPSIILDTDPGTRWLNIYSPLAGSGDFTIYVSDSGKRVNLRADNSAFTGGLSVRGQGKFIVFQEENLGGNPAAYRADQLTLGGAVVVATNSFVINDVNRGIKLDNIALTSTVATSSGNLPIYTYPGAVFEVNAATVTVACAISGDGPLTKTGDGTLLLGGTNSYNGLTRVENGTLVLTAGATHALSSILVTGESSQLEGEGSLSNLMLEAGATLNVKDAGFDIQHMTVSNNDAMVHIFLSLSDTATNTPAIRISDDLVKGPGQLVKFELDSGSLPDAPCMLMEASNLTDYAITDFYISSPWIGSLSMTNISEGSSVLLFTPASAGTVVYQDESDWSGVSAFTRSAAWSDNLAPSAGKIYVDESYILRTPTTGSVTFPGDKLFISGNALFALKGTGTPTVNNLVLLNNATLSASEGNTVGNNIAGGLELIPGDAGGLAATFLISPDGMGRTLRTYSVLSGNGDILLEYLGTAFSPASYFTFYSDSPGFYGRITVGGNTNIWLRISSEENLGGNPPLFRADQLIFDGGGLSVINDVTLDDSRRGITLSTGGGTLKAEAGTTLTVNCPVSGAGVLMKKGDGTLVLGGDNSFSGTATVYEGSVRPTSPGAFGVAQVNFCTGSTLQIHDSDTALLNGVEFDDTVTFEVGSRLQVILDKETEYGGSVSVPLFLLPAGETIDIESLSIVYTMPGYGLEVISETIGDGDSARERVSVKLVVTGTLVFIQ